MIRVREQVNNAFITTCRYWIQTKADSYFWVRKQIFTGKTQKKHSIGKVFWHTWYYDSNLRKVTTLSCTGICISDILEWSKYFSMLNNANNLHIFTVLEDLKTFVMFTGFSYCLSPVLASLTETISTDTIYAMTTVMLLANLAFHNYGVQAALLVHI